METKKVIIAVERALCHQLEGMKKMGPRLVSLPNGVAWQQLCIKVPAQLQIVEKPESKNVTYNAQLKFLTSETIDSREKQVFRVTLAGGKQMLIGTDWRPFCVVQVVENMPNRVTESQLNEVTVSYSDRWAPPYILSAHPIADDNAQYTPEVEGPIS